MRKREALSRRERRQFDELVKAFFEPAAPDPQAPDGSAASPGAGPSSGPDQDQDRHQRGTA